MSANITYIFIVLLYLKFCHCADFSEDDYNNHGAELQQSVNLARQEYAQKMCNIYNSDYRSVEDLSSKDLNHILIDHKHRLLYCYVPKVACTNWKRLLLYLSGNSNTSDILSIPASLVHSNGVFDNLGMIQDLEERNRILNNYTKFVMVRHPFERLLSAYRNKLQGNGSSALYFQSRIGKYIVKNFRRNPSTESLQKGHDVTFREFCEYIISIDKSPKLNKLYSKNPSVIMETGYKNGDETVTSNKNLVNDDRTNIDTISIKEISNSITTNSMRLGKSISKKDVTRKQIVNYEKSTKAMNMANLMNMSKLSTKLATEKSYDNPNIIDKTKNESNYDTGSMKTSTVRSSTSANGLKNLKLAEVFNEHWTPAYQLCHPCSVKYNIIGKYATLRSDSHLLLSIINPNGKVQFPSSPNHKSSTSDHLAKALSTLPVELLEKLYHVYEMDFRIFGYSLENLLGFELA